MQAYMYKKKLPLIYTKKMKPYCSIHVTIVHNFHINNSNKKFLPFSSLSEDPELNQSNNFYCCVVQKPLYYNYTVLLFS